MNRNLCSIILAFTFLFALSLACSLGNKSNNSNESGNSNSQSTASTTGEEKKNRIYTTSDGSSYVSDIRMPDSNGNPHDNPFLQGEKITLSVGPSYDRSNMRGFVAEISPIKDDGNTSQTYWERVTVSSIPYSGNIFFDFAKTPRPVGEYKVEVYLFTRSQSAPILVADGKIYVQ